MAVGSIVTIAVVLLLLVMVKIVVDTGTEIFSGEGYPRRSPFAAVTWQESDLQVQFDGEWYSLVSLEGLPANEIVTFSQTTYGNLWKTRFEEDLVEYLVHVGHPPPDEVHFGGSMADVPGDASLGGGPYDVCESAGN